MGYHLVSQPYSLRFYGHWPSKSCLLALLLQVAVFVLPLLLQLSETYLY